MSFKAGNIASKCGVMCLHVSIGTICVLQHFPHIHWCVKNMFIQPLDKVVYAVFVGYDICSSTHIYLCVLVQGAVLSIQSK